MRRTGSFEDSQLSGRALVGGPFGARVRPGIAVARSLKRRVKAGTEFARPQAP